jgi:hypothetical protein
MTNYVRERESQRERREERTTSAKGKQTISVVQFLISKGAFDPSSNVVVCNENFGLVFRLVFRI